jgi:hypothetical protein
MQPPLFTKAEDPLDADVWLRVVESKFPLLSGDYPDDTKARFTAAASRPCSDLVGPLLCYATCSSRSFLGGIQDCFQRAPHPS